MLRFLVPLLLLTLLAGCASSPDKDPAEAADKKGLPAYERQTDIGIRWRTVLGDGAGNAYVRLQPAVAGDMLYAADVSGRVVALELSSGDEQWQVRLDAPVLAGVTIAGEQLFLITRDGFLHCLNRADGASLWRSRLTSESLSPAVADARRVFVHTVDGRVTAFERADGQQAWSYETAMPVLTLRGTGAPLVLDQLVVIGFATGKVVALDKVLGIPRWEVRLGSPDGRSELERLVDVDGQPVWDDGIIYAAGYHGKVAAISLNGETRWQEDGSSYTHPELALGNLYLTLDSDVIQAYDQSNGARVWQQPALSGRKLGQVTAHGRWLTVADADGYLHVLSQVNGELSGRRLLRPKPLHISYPNQTEATNWRLLRGKHMGVRSTMVSTPEGLLVYTNHGELLLLDIRER